MKLMSLIMTFIAGGLALNLVASLIWDYIRVMSRKALIVTSVLLIIICILVVIVNEQQAKDDKNTSSNTFSAPSSVDAQQRSGPAFTKQSSSQVKTPPEPELQKHPDPVPPPVNREITQTVNVYRGRTADVFGGELFISLVAIPFEGDPLRHTIIATVGAPGYPTITLNHKDVGYTVLLKAKKTYEIKVAEADTFDATFRISVISKTTSKKRGGISP